MYLTYTQQSAQEGSNISLFWRGLLKVGLNSNFGTFLREQQKDMRTKVRLGPGIACILTQVKY